MTFSADDNGKLCDKQLEASKELLHFPLKLSFKFE